MNLIQFLAMKLVQGPVFRTFKKIIECFFRKTEHVTIVPLEQRRTVNSQGLQPIRRTNHRRRITFHHDNANSHTSAQTTAF